MAKKKSTATLKSEAAKLKKAGLIDIDLRKVTDKKLAENPEQRSWLMRTINKFTDVVTGKAATVKVEDKKARKALRSRGHRTVRNNLVIIDRKPNETIKADKKGNITYTRPVKDRKSGKLKLEVITEPNIDFKEIKTVEDAVAVYAEMYKQNAGDKIAFTYYGNIAKETHANAKEAMLKVISYTQPQNDIGTSLDPADVAEIMKAVQIVKYIGIDSKGDYGRARAEIYDTKAQFNKYFKKLSKKRVKK